MSNEVKAKIDIKNALMGLDMVHADLWLKLENLKATKVKSLVVNQVELECLLILLETSMKNLGARFVEKGAAK